jgi:serine/threonine-protein kinase HipA
MSCSGCYKQGVVGYCLSCRKRLFDKLRIPAVLDFDAPGADNLSSYQEHTKRLSISGVQLKYSLRLENNNLELCEKGGQYILKPIPVAKQLAELNQVPENEHLTMQIAEQLFGINTAANGLITFQDGQQAYITKRFDVRPDGLKYLQEDFAQLTNRTKATHGEGFKYEGSYFEIGLLIKRYVAAAMPALERFFQIVLFNYIVSNGDAHLKNFSLIRSESGEYQLAPAYDLMSTVIHTPQESDTALALYAGDMNSDFYAAHGYYGRANFMELASRMGIVEKRASRIMEGFVGNQKQVATMVDGSFLSAAAKVKYLAAYNNKLNRLA